MERAFWREVGTRTIAGVLTIVIIGVPALIWAAVTGVLTWDTAAPILIGLGLFLLLLIVYIVALWVITRIERKKVAKALKKDRGPTSSPIPSAEVFLSYSAEHRARILDMVSQLTKDRITEAERTARASTKWATVGATSLGVISLISTVAAAIAQALLR